MSYVISNSQFRSIHAIPRDLSVTCCLPDAPINQSHGTKSRSRTGIVAVSWLVDLTHQLFRFIYISLWTGFFLVMFSASETSEDAIQFFEGDQIPSLENQSHLSLLYLRIKCRANPRPPKPFSVTRSPKGRKKGAEIIMNLQMRELVHGLMVRYITRYAEFRRLNSHVGTFHVCWGVCLFVSCWSICCLEV